MTCKRGRLLQSKEEDYLNAASRLETYIMNQMNGETAVHGKGNQGCVELNHLKLLI